MEKVYTFFGFRGRIKNWLKSIGTSRTTGIILGQQEHSDTFQLEKGHVQGDSPSPLLYNFAAQILLFRIELDKEIKPIRPPLYRPGPIIPSAPFKNESKRETDKSDCFAEDNTISTVFELESLKALKNILCEFGQLSGLCTNYEKSALLCIGNTQGDTPVK